VYANLHCSACGERIINYECSVGWERREDFVGGGDPRIEKWIQVHKEQCTSARQEPKPAQTAPPLRVIRRSKQPQTIVAPEPIFSAMMWVINTKTGQLFQIKTDDVDKLNEEYRNGLTDLKPYL